MCLKTRRSDSCGVNQASCNVSPANLNHFISKRTEVSLANVGNFDMNACSALVKVISPVLLECAFIVHVLCERPTSSGTADSLDLHLRNQRNQDFKRGCCLDNRRHRWADVLQARVLSTFSSERRGVALKQANTSATTTDSHKQRVVSLESTKAKREMNTPDFGTQDSSGLHLQIEETSIDLYCGFDD